MTPAEKVIATLALLSEQSGEKVSMPRLEFMARKLLPLGADSVQEALEKLLETARRFPTVQEVKDVMGLGEPTARDAGNEIASRIVTAVARCGIPVGPKGIAARDEMLGASALQIVRKLGGWALVVDQAGENLTALKAQIRDLAEAAVRTGQLEVERPHALPSYGEAFAIVSARLQDLPALPENKRMALEEKKANLHKIREELGAGKITDDEALELIDLADKQCDLKGDETPW